MPSPRKRGFTLLELILVLLVISVVLAIATPSLQGFMASRATADCAQHVLGLTRLARSEAISLGRPCRLNVDVEAGQYWVTMQQAGKFVSPQTDLGRKFAVPEGASIKLSREDEAQGADYVQFLPNGRAEVATIEITGRHGEQYRVTAESPCEPYRIVTPTEGQ